METGKLSRHARESLVSAKVERFRRQKIQSIPAIEPPLGADCNGAGYPPGRDDGVREELAAGVVRLKPKTEVEATSILPSLNVYTDLGPLQSWLPFNEQQHNIYAVVGFKIGRFD